MNREDWAELRALIREDMERSDRRWAQTVARWDKREERRHKEVMATLAEQRQKTDRLLEESRAHTGALLAVIDRLNGGGGAAPAT